jgi:16S rRNA (guanine966-N2)-methyltransferase
MIINQDAFIFLDKNTAVLFDFILLDPPFHKNYLVKALKLIAKNNFIADNGKIYIESEFKITLDFLTENFPKKVKIKKKNLVQCTTVY